MEESPPPAPERTHMPPEAVLSDFRRNCELEVGHVYTAEERELIAHTLHDKLEHLEAAEMLHKYEAGTVPTLDSIRRTADTAIAVLTEDASDIEALTHAKLIEGQVMQVRRWSRRYVETIIKFHRSRLAFMREGEEGQKDMFVSADAERRRVHEALLSSLSTMNNLIARGQDLAEFRAPISWKPGMALPEGTAREHPMMFSAEAIRDRDLIRDWAIIADSVEEMRTVVRKMEKTEQNETAAPEGDGRILDERLPD